jgi:hypothetical protein
MDLSGKSMSELVTMYNAKADLMDRPKVKRFSDRKAAEKRVNQIVNAIGGVASKTNGGTPDMPVPAPVIATPAQINKAKARVKRVKAEGELVGKGSYRDKLLGFLQAESRVGKPQPISRLMEAVYGQARKDFKGPLMMVMKGLKVVLDTNKTGLEIRKSRENKENHFGLFPKGN